MRNNGAESKEHPAVMVGQAVQVAKVHPGGDKMPEILEKDVGFIVFVAIVYFLMLFPAIEKFPPN